MAKEITPDCAHCPVKACEPKIPSGETPRVNKAPGYCPMKTRPEIYPESLAEYDKEEVRDFARLAAVQEFECYESVPEGRRTKNPRILELVQFAQKCGYKKLGLAFCGGLAFEAGLLTDVLESHGFEVVSVKCKTGAVPKERIGVRPEEKIAGPDSFEPMCNPLVQAEILNQEKVDLAVMMGLCIGHDTLFLKYCRVPVTVIAVKDRVTGHNPLVPLYLINSYYASIKGPGAKS